MPDSFTLDDGYTLVSLTTAAYADSVVTVSSSNSANGDVLTFDVPAGTHKLEIDWQYDAEKVTFGLVSFSYGRADFFRLRKIEYAEIEGKSASTEIDLAEHINLWPDEDVIYGPGIIVSSDKETLKSGSTIENITFTSDWGFRWDPALPIGHDGPHDNGWRQLPVPRDGVMTLPLMHEYVNFNAKDTYLGFNVEKKISVNEITFLSRSVSDNPKAEMERDYLSVIDCCSILYVDKGSLDYMCDDKKLRLRAGDVIITKKDVSYNITHEYSASYYFIHFNAESTLIDFLAGKKFRLPKVLINYFADIYKEISSSFSSVSTDENSYDNDCFADGCSNIYNFHFKNARINPDAPLCSQQYVCTYLELIIMGLFRTYAEKEEYIVKTQDIENIPSEIAKFLKANVFGKITAADIRYQFPFCNTILSTEFKKAYGYTMMRYYNELKINEAKKIISENVYSMSEIAELLMFANIYDFSRVFKRIAGISPSEYKILSNR